MLRRPRAALGAALVLVGLVTSAASAVGPSSFVGAEDGLLVVAAEPAHPARLGPLAAGGSVTWTVAARLLDATRADLALRLVADGDLVHPTDGLVVHVEACSTGIAAGEDLGTVPPCAGEWRTVVPSAPLTSVASSSDARTWTLPLLTDHSSVVLRVHLSLPATAGDATGRSGEVAVGLFATGDEDLTPAPTPTAEPTVPATPTAPPTAAPSADPTASPTPSPAASPTPTVAPTPAPTAPPTPDPTVAPTPDPTVAPTPDPTAAPTPDPTAPPTAGPAVDPEPTPGVRPTPTPAPMPTDGPAPTSAPPAAPDAPEGEPATAPPAGPGGGPTGGSTGGHGPASPGTRGALALTGSSPLATTLLSAALVAAGVLVLRGARREVAA